MNSPTEAMVLVGGVEAAISLGGIAVLDPPIVLDKFCPECGEDTRFVIEFRFANGLFGTCTRCGQERVAPFTRAISEVA